MTTTEEVKKPRKPTVRRKFRDNGNYAIATFDDEYNRLSVGAESFPTAGAAIEHAKTTRRGEVTIIRLVDRFTVETETKVVARIKR